MNYFLVALPQVRYYLGQSDTGDTQALIHVFCVTSETRRVTEVSRLICSDETREKPEQSCRYNFQCKPAGWLHCALQFFSSSAPKAPSSCFIFINVNLIHKKLQNYAFQYLNFCFFKSHRDGARICVNGLFNIMRKQKAFLLKQL